METNFKGTSGDIKDACKKANGYLVFAHKTKGVVFEEGFIAGAKWQQEQINCDLPELLEMYNEMLEVLQNVLNNSKVPHDLFHIAKNVVKKSLKTLE